MALSEAGRPASRRGRGRLIAAIVAAVVSTGVAGYAVYSAAPGKGPVKPAAKPAARTRVTSVRETIPATSDDYLGVYEEDVPDSYTQVDQFAQMAGRQPNLVLYYNGWAQPFQASFARMALAHGATVIDDLEPTSVTLAAIVDGQQDSYLDGYAQQIKRFGHPVILSFGPEMNGNWYSWGWTHDPPQQFVAAWRHVVDVFRELGVTNITWMWTVNGIGGSTGPVADYWPGAEYVDWVGIDSYYYLSTDTFNTVFAPTIAAVREFDKPILISETAVGQVAGQTQKIPGLLKGVKHSGVLGFVWFDVAQDQGLYHQDWRLEGQSPAVAAEFRDDVKTYLK
jgi:mannan endo-1,4-beta-mannosidase